MKNNSISYLITVSKQHFLPAQMLILSLRNQTLNPIIVVGNLDHMQSNLIKSLGVKYIDEDDINYKARLPRVEWQEKYREFGWYKQMFIRLCIDTFMETDQVIILDSEVFVFDNWDESRMYDPSSGKPRAFYWVPEKRKPDWDYKMYKGAAFLLSFLPQCKDIMQYADSDNYKRHISGVYLFSTKNIKKLWDILANNTELQENIDTLFNKRDDLSFSEYELYGLAVEYGLFEDEVPTVLHEGLLGWYDNHKEKVFEKFKKNAMWSMCQNYSDFALTPSYLKFINDTAKKLKRRAILEDGKRYCDYSLVDKESIYTNNLSYFKKYKRQLNYTEKKRYDTMYSALKQLLDIKKTGATIVEIGTQRDSTKGGGHSTYKFGEFCKKYGGKIITVDILEEAIDYSIKNTTDFQPWINYVVSDSTSFLKGFEEKIDLLYLDGLDSTPGQERAASKKQLREIKAAMPKLSKKCVVLLDDADLPEEGKVRLSSKFLLKKGFKLTKSGYQQLYTRNRV